jgi:pantothenate kinase type III
MFTSSVLDFSSPEPSRSPATNLNSSVDRIPPVWFALCIGNTRSHWAYIEHRRICALWEAPHLTQEEFDGDIWRELQHWSQRYRRSDPPQHTPRFYSTDPPDFTNPGDLPQAASLATEVSPEPNPDPNPEPNDARPPRTQPTSNPSGRPPDVAPRIPIVIASVVPSQTQLWQTWLDSTTYPYRILSLADIPLAGLYPTLGIDRALAGLGVGQQLGFPCLTIDGGTALTFTGFSGMESAKPSRHRTQDGVEIEHRSTDLSDLSGLSDAFNPSDCPGLPDLPELPELSETSHSSHSNDLTPALGILIGGAILPGMGLQYRSLGQQTAQLSAVRSSVEANAALRPFPATRWARDTLGAIDSGIHRAIGAIAWDFITDWRRRYPAAIVVITGGDAMAIEVAIQQHVRDRDGRPLSEYERTRLMVVPEAIIWGMIAALEAIALTPHSPDRGGDS